MDISGSGRSNGIKPSPTSLEVKMILLKKMLAIASLAVINLPVQAAPPSYTFTELNYGVSPEFSSLNSYGQLVGRIYQENAYHAFIYSEGQGQDLGRLNVTAINDKSQVVGNVAYSSNGYSLNTRGFLISEGRTHDLGTLGGAKSEALDINSQGQIVGNSTTASGETHAFLYDKGHMQELNGLQGDSFAAAINDQGNIAGYSYPGGAFLYRDGQVHDLGKLGGATIPVGINSKDQIVGNYTWTIQYGIREHPFIYSDGQLKDLFSPEDGNGRATAINDSGQVVGWGYFDNGSAPFLYDNGLLYDINTLLAKQLGLTLGAALDINNNGQILARGETCIEIQWGCQVQNHYYLLTPTTVPLPAAFWLFGFTLVSWLLYGIRKGYFLRGENGQNVHPYYKFGVIY